MANIPLPYSRIFDALGSFNAVQSALFDELFCSDKSVVLSAPTGSGKTVAFELAIVRMLLQQKNSESKENSANVANIKAIYVAPIKALCAEKFEDWNNRFNVANIHCVIITGDTDLEDMNQVHAAHVIITTPEKWDSLTRHWRDYRNIITSVRLFMIDEVHLLNEDVRGPVLEAIVSRMHNIAHEAGMNVIRYVVASATIPNVGDITRWISTVETLRGIAKVNCVAQLVFADSQRPVPLEKHVLGFNSRLLGFQFDISLNYKLMNILKKYAECKASLIFCNSRKSAEMAATTLEKNFSAYFQLSEQQKENLTQLAHSLHDTKLRRLALHGIAFHHAGVSYADRCLIEENFRQGNLMTLLCTNTLAMGVNLPAHLVIIKSTETYHNGLLSEYPESAILQMIGRAGRPKYDTKGVAVILTQMKNVSKYENLMNGKMPVESHLHKHLAEHLNSEIALGTINNLEMAMTWIRSTYLYVRAIQNPAHYGLSSNTDKDIIETELETMCLVQINALKTTCLIAQSQVNEFDIQTTHYGKLMAKYYLSFETMKFFRQLHGTETLFEIIEIIVHCKEFNMFTLRVNEKRCLNELNDYPLRFPIRGRVKTCAHKISCLIQAVLANIQIPTPSLAQESMKMLRIAERVAKCLLEYMRLSINEADEFPMGSYKALLHIVTITKCFHAKLWENSEYAVKQLHKIGVVYSGLLVNAGKTTLKSLAETDARTIESIVNKTSPFGDEVLQNLNTFPEYSLEFYKQSANMLGICIRQINETYLFKGTNTMVIVGDSANNLLLHIENLDNILLEFGVFVRSISLPNVTVQQVSAHVIHGSLVGVDKEACLVLDEPSCESKTITTKRKATRKRKMMVNKSNDTKKQRKSHKLSSTEVYPPHPKPNKQFIDLNEFSYNKQKLQHISVANGSSLNSKRNVHRAAPEGSDNKNVVNNEGLFFATKKNLAQTKLTQYFVKMCGFEEKNQKMNALKNVPLSGGENNAENKIIENDILNTPFLLRDTVPNNDSLMPSHDLVPVQNNITSISIDPFKIAVHPCDASPNIRNSIPKELTAIENKNSVSRSDTFKNIPDRFVPLDLSRSSTNAKIIMADVLFKEFSSLDLYTTSSSLTSLNDDSVWQCYKVTKKFLHLNEEERTFSNFKKIYHDCRNSNGKIKHITTKKEKESTDNPNHNSFNKSQQLPTELTLLKFIKSTSSVEKHSRNSALTKSPSVALNNNPFRLQIFKNSGGKSFEKTPREVVKQINKEVMDLVLRAKCEMNDDRGEMNSVDFEFVEKLLEQSESEDEPGLTFEEYCRKYIT